MKKLLIGLLLLTSSVFATQVHFDSISVGTPTTLTGSMMMDLFSTDKAAKPCPTMTEAQRDLLTGVTDGACIFNSDTSIQNTYSSGWGWTTSGVSRLDQLDDVGITGATISSMLTYDGTTWVNQGISQMTEMHEVLPSDEAFETKYGTGSPSYNVFGTMPQSDPILLPDYLTGIDVEAFDLNLNGEWEVIIEFKIKDITQTEQQVLIGGSSTMNSGRDFLIAIIPNTKNVYIGGGTGESSYAFIKNMPNLDDTSFHTLKVKRILSTYELTLDGTDFYTGPALSGNTADQWIRTIGKSNNGATYDFDGYIKNYEIISTALPASDRNGSFSVSTYLKEGSVYINMNLCAKRVYRGGKWHTDLPIFEWGRGEKYPEGVIVYSGSSFYISKFLHTSGTGTIQDDIAYWTFQSPTLISSGNSKVEVIAPNSSTIFTNNGVVTGMLDETTGLTITASAQYNNTSLMGVNEEAFTSKYYVDTLFDETITATPMTTLGDLIYYDTAGINRLPVGTLGQVLTASGSTVLWADPAGGGGTTFNDSTFNIFNDVDNTKIFDFDASSITTGTTRTYIMPDSDGTIALTSDTISATPMTTLGDLVFQNVAGIDRLPLGSEGQVLTASGSTVSWEDASVGFSNPMTNEGDIMYHSATDTATRLPVGTAGQVLTTDGTSLSWEDPTGGGGGGQIVAGTGSLSYGAILAGENIDGGTNPKSIYLKKERVLKVTDDIKYIDVVEDGGSEVSVAIDLNSYITSDLGSGSASLDLLQVIEDEFNSHVSLSGTYDWDFDSSTMTASVSATGLTSLSFNTKTGTHGSDNSDDGVLPNVLNFDDTADLTGALHYTATDSVIDNTEFSVFAYNTDTDISFAANPVGLAIETATKLTTLNPYFSGTISGFDSTFSIGDRFYTWEEPGGMLVSGSPSLNERSTFFGVSTSESALSFNLIPDVINYPYKFKETPDDKDFGSDISLSGSAENAMGKGVRVVLKSDNYYYIQYKNGFGLPWVDSATTINSNKTYADNWWSKDIDSTPKVVIDENGLSLIAVMIYNQDATNKKGITIYESTDLSSWSLVRADHNGSTDYNLKDLVMREDKAVMFFTVNNDIGTYYLISDNSGSGFASWSQVGPFGSIAAHQAVAGFIQYFPLETGINKHRPVFIGQGTNALEYNYSKGDGTSLAGNDIAGGVTGYVMTATQKINGNEILVAFNNGANSETNLYEAEFIGTYNGGTLTYNNHSKQNINDTAVAQDVYFGMDTESTFYASTQVKNRSIYVNEFAYIAHTFKNNASGKVGFQLFWTKNITGGTWETSIPIGQTTGHCQELNLQYIPTTNGLLATWKHLPTAALTANFSNGQIFSRYIQLAGDGTPVPFDIVQVDGGKIEAGFAGWMNTSSSSEGVTINWEQSNGTYGTVKTNRFY